MRFLVKDQVEEIPGKRINFLGCFIFPATSSPGMFGILLVFRWLLAVLHRPTSGSSPQERWGWLRRLGASVALWVNCQQKQQQLLARKGKDAEGSQQRP